MSRWRAIVDALQMNLIGFQRERGLAMFTTEQKRLLKKIRITRESGQVWVGVRVYDRRTRRWYWMSYTNHDGEIYGDWDQYIFFLNDGDDRIRKARQENPDFFAEVEWRALAILYKLGFASDNFLNEKRIKQAEKYL